MSAERRTRGWRRGAVATGGRRLRSGLRNLLECDAVALLGGWATSRGARLEVKVATELGLDVALVDVWLDRARPDDDASSAGDRDASTSGGAS